MDTMEEQLGRRERVAVSRLHALFELLPTALDKELVGVGLTTFEFTLLDALADADHGRLRLSALAARTNATLPRLSRVVTALERKGLVERVPCTQDGRATNAVLTVAGMQACRRARPRYAQAVRRLALDGLDADEVDQLAAISYSILARLDPECRFAITAEVENAGEEGADARVCAADPAPCPADPEP